MLTGLQIVEETAPTLIADTTSALLLRNFDPAPPDEAEDAPEWTDDVSDECRAKVCCLLFPLDLQCQC